jgi:RNA polymerase sigma-70 factor (ECF subfamily)
MSLLAKRQPEEPATKTFREVYDRWFHQVERWIRALGGPRADIEDLAQEVFLVVYRRLGDFDGDNLPGWLFRITTRKVRDHRLTAWVRYVLPWRTQEREPVSALPLALEIVEQKQRTRTLYRILDGMSEKRRTVLILFEIEGHSGEEIAALLGIPLKTVWTRLHHARRDLLDAVAALQRKGRLP